MGGLASIMCAVSLTILIYNEYQILIKPVYKKNYTVASDHSHDHIKVNLNIDFPNCPCWLLEFEHMPATETTRMSPSDIA